MAVKIFRINYKSDFILTLNSDAGWMTPFCIKFWTGAPSQAYFAGWDGTTYTHCHYDPSEPTKLVVQFDDHHLPIGDLKFQIGYHFTVADFPNDTEDEVINPANITVEIDGQTYQVMLDFTGETAPEIEFSLPAYANEQQRIANEQARIANEETRVANEEQRVENEQARVEEYADLKADAVEATAAANDAAALANQKAQLAQQKAGLADDAATLATQKAGLAADAATLANQKAQLAQQKAGLADNAATLATQKAELADDAATLATQKAGLANDAATLANQKAQYASDQGDYAKAQGDYAKAQADVIPVDVTSSQTDATFVNGNHDPLFYLRQANSSLAGLMTAAGYTKLNDMPSAQEVNAGLAYDVSVLHPTSGVNGGSTYASLSAALAVIPQDKRKGGMTVKFVLSSDNKYVQYRLTSTSFNIVETNWVEDNIELLDFKVLGGYSAISPTVTLNKMYVDANLKIIDLSSAAGTYNMELYCYEVTKGQIIRINIPKTTGFGKVLSFFYNTPAANVIGGGFVDSITKNQPLVDYLYTSPDDGYLCVGYNTTENSPTAEAYIQGLENLEVRVSDIEEELSSEVEVDLAASADAYVTKDQQKYVVLSSSVGLQTKFYSVIKNKTYRYYITDTKVKNSIPVSFFEEIPFNGDAVYSALDVQGGSGIAAEGSFISPVNGYVCLCGNKNKGFSLVQVKGTIDNRISAIKAEVDEVKESSVSREELYAEGETVYELPDELIGTSIYTGQTGCGIIHKAAEREVFNRITCCICRPQTANTGTFAIYKSSSTPNINNAESILSINNFSSDNFAVAGELFTIDFDNDVVLEEDEYLFTYFSGICSLYLYETATRSDESEREGFVFHGSYNTYRYSSSMTLSTRDGDIVALQKAIEGESTEDIRITIPDDLYCIKGKPQWFYYNTFIFGKESVYGNNIDNYHIETTASTTSIGTEKEDGFCIEANTTGNYSIEIRIYDQEMNFIVSKTVTVHVVESNNTLNGKNILMLGDSWTDPSIPIAAQSPAKGYTAETDAALKELGLTLNFVGSIDCGVNGLKNEGRGGYAWDTYSKAPTQVRFKFFVETMPNVSIGDVYTNNGSSYTVFEKGDGYITMTRTYGTDIPSGNTLTKSSGSGDETITFTSYAQTTGNPFWNPTSEKVDFTYWRNLIGLSDTLDIVTIQLGVNDCLGVLKTTKSQWKENLDGASTIIDAILEDSPSCKVIVNLVGLDAPSNTAWSSLNGLSSSKSTYQSNVYYLRKYINEMLAERNDFGTSVFIGQSVLGMNRWYGYEYLDVRNVFFQIDPQTLSPTILNNLRNKAYTFFHTDNVFLRLYGYDERGYAILRPFLGTSWVGRDQEFTGSKSDFDFSTIPATGNLVLDADHSVAIPYSAVKVENDNLKIHYFANATHPHARGYREMARTLVSQIVSI